jgi:demethylspheroidene O-methyltransferase
MTLPTSLPGRPEHVPGAAARGLVARWQGLRDRLLASPAFRRRAIAFAPTRWIARRRAAALFDLVAGFVYSQVLHACVRLGVFDLLAATPLPAEDIARSTALPLESALRLLDAAIALRLLERRGGARYGLGPLGAAMVANPAVTAMVEHHATLYADLGDPVALLRGRLGDLARYWPYAGEPTPSALAPPRVADYSALMAASQPLVADEILDACPLGRHRCLLDVGGGEGGFLAAAGRRHPALRLMLFDLPAVAQRAAARFEAEGLAGRATALAGDFLREPLPRGADVVSLVRVVHDQDDDGMRRLLAAAFEALPPGGVVLVGEPMAGTKGSQAMGDAYFGMYLLAMGRGRPRSAAELGGALREAGFVAVRQLPTRMPLQTSLLRAERPRTVSPSIV